MYWVEPGLWFGGFLLRVRFIAHRWWLVWVIALFLSDIGGTALKEFDVNTDEAEGGGKLEGKRYGFF